MDDDLLEVEREPRNAETPLAALSDDQTPTRLVYVRNHFAAPAIDSEHWRLVLEGEVAHRLELSLADLRSLPCLRVPLVLECAGNGRKGLKPAVPGVDWGWGAVSRVVFGGARLSDLLHRAGLAPGAREILAEGADSGAVDGRQERFARSLPLERAAAGDVLIAWEMNGEALTPEHGFPARLVVPGWYGMASVKWLTRLVALAQPFEGHFQRSAYVYRRSGTPDEPVTTVRVRSIITAPSDGADLRLGPVEVVGLAWSGAGGIRSVEVGDGTSWTQAQLEREVPDHAVRWRWRWVPSRAGEFLLQSRATDVMGNVQPTKPPWNAQGYGNNGPHAVQVRVVV